MAKNWLILAAGGNGIRMRKRISKIFLPLSGRPIIYHSLKKMERSKTIDKIVITVRKEYFPKIQKLIKARKLKKIVKLIPANHSRQQSTWFALKWLKKEKIDDSDLVGVHNAVNPFVSLQEIKEVFTAAKKYGAAILAMPAKDTVKISLKNNLVAVTPNREAVWYAQTPQVAKFALLYKAFKKASLKKDWGTDDATLLERIKAKVKIVPCSWENFKITYPGDIILAQDILAKRKMERVGFGQDSHWFELNKNKPLILGGVTVSKNGGLKANSDGDVVLHSLCNALSSAIGSDSLGTWADKMCLEEGITDSSQFVKSIFAKVVKKGYRVVNVSLGIEAKKPKITQALFHKMKVEIANLLKINKESVGITITSGEGITAFGQGKAMQVFCQVLLGRNET